MLFDNVTLSIILQEFYQESPKLYSFITIFDVFQDRMSEVLLEDVESHVNREKIRYLFFK